MKITKFQKPIVKWFELVNLQNNLAAKTIAFHVGIPDFVKSNNQVNRYLLHKYKYGFSF